MDPKSITKRPKIKPKVNRLVRTGVVGGDWDQETIPLENTGYFYESMMRRYKEGVKWENTKYYEDSVERIKQGESRRDVNSVLEFKNSLENLDDIFDDIKINGYKSQLELDSIRDNMSPFFSEKELKYPPEFREVTVDISREGELLWNDGQHRLYIAKILDLDQIPIRIRVRHEKWQHVRDQAFKKNSLPNQVPKNHPDII
ncbi:hypothetical protein [Natrialba sp. SSL1]|uniref:hypothetical protein n=1 Tax=Natrialba sp. SSL1 TaxID=1869245 RepID=UPI001113A210|nr:hypothetical protein [Natrialba sp. SSL1]